jgi:hypothetical protein
LPLNYLFGQKESSKWMCAELQWLLSASV